ncbi:glycosyl hydrolase [Frigoribacterium salinisoli]
MTGCTTASVDPDDAATSRPVGGQGTGTVFPAEQVDPLVAALPTESVAAPPEMRLADGLVPPTNRWFSGLAFGDAPMPVFPYPISFQVTGTGFAAGLPEPVASADAIVSTALPQVGLDLGADGTVVSDYDAVAVTVEHRAGDRALGRTTIAEGSPLVSYVAAEQQEVALTTPLDDVDEEAGRGTVEVGDALWAVAVTGGRLDRGSVELDEGGSVVLAALPAAAADDADRLDELLDAAASPLTGVTVERSDEGDAQRTTLRYASASGEATLVVAAPHQEAPDGAAGLDYATVYGEGRLGVATSLGAAAPTVRAEAGLDLEGLDDAERDELREHLVADVAALPTFAADTYFGGKSLYRAAMLLELAEQLGDDASADTLRTALVDALDRWTDPEGCATRDQECFVHDEAMHGVVGKAASFGADEFNDHHFHYGYFLYAAGVVAADDERLAERWAPVLDLLAADIASDAGSGTFPDQRAFDPYWSHSWASGTSPFVDGNNQESSSEAVTAYAGLSLWAAASGDDALAAEATWMTSAEAAAALAYFVAPDLSSPVLEGFDHDLVSLNWGSKRDHATWFSAEPSAITGIQLIPLSPSSIGYLTSEAAGGPDHVDALVASAAPDGYEGALGDFVLMYSALAGREQAAAAREALAALPDDALDDGNSRTYATAFVMVAGARD